MKPKLRKKWWFGFLSLFGFVGIQGILAKDWLKAGWILWFIWAIYFIPTETLRKIFKQKP